MVNLDKKKVIAIVIVLVAIALVFLIIKTKNCGSDDACFNSASAKCSRAKVTTFSQENQYHYQVLGEKRDNCIIEVTLLDLSDSQPTDVQRALEGKSMTCAVPLTELQTTAVKDMENLIDMCSGQLKEANLQIAIDKMYEIIVKNIGPIALEFQRGLS